MGIITSILSILSSLFERVNKRNSSLEVKKGAEASRDTEIHIENTNAVLEAAKTNDLEELRKRAGE